ncbi:MAG: HAD family phosphatase [Caldilineales bacterium]|nr:HAD family phosphatase [Caldilineales bacterium]
MPIRLIACDLDGTLADHDGHISDESVAALRRARAEGILVVPATGRMPYVIDHFLDRIEATSEPVITAQGALVGYRDGRLLRRLTLDPAIAREAAEIAKQFEAGMAYFTEDTILVDKFQTSPALYRAWFGGQALIHPDALSQINGHLIKFMVIHDDPDRVPAILAELHLHIGRRADITRSWHWFVEGTTPGADKGTALAWLCQRLGIDRHEVIAIGDGGNDVTMLKWAGFSAAPASADPFAIAAADWLAPPIEDSPVAATLAHYLGW